MSQYSQLLYLLVLAAFLVTVLMQAVRKNVTLVTAYSLQSVAVVGVLFYLASRSHSGFTTVFLIIAVLTLVVKVWITPRILRRLIARHSLTNTATTYANLPVTLISVVALVALSHSHIFSSFVSLETDVQTSFGLAVATMFLSLLLLVNRKGIFSQVLGVLSLENAVVMCASFVGLEESLGFEIGISFDLVVWVTMATLFVSLVYKHFGTLDVTAVNRLTD